MAKKKRVEISVDVAARVLFLSDRTCCVCRIRGKPVQVHHIDEDPSNNSFKNLAVLCFDCHRDTQIRGGFDRKLDADQVILYRDDWYRIVAQQRATHELTTATASRKDRRKIELVTSIAESYRENQQYELLAMHYDSIGNYELRDKYIEVAIQEDPRDQTICFLRGLQGKPELIPEDVIERELSYYTKNEDWLQRARFYKSLGKHHKATVDYIKGIGESLDEDRLFSAAYYLKELVEENLIEELFILALKQATEEGDLWWQVRALQELGWDEELDELVLQNSEEIERSGDLLLHILLADAKGDEQQSMELRKISARNTYVGVISEDEDDTQGD